MTKDGSIYVWVLVGTTVGLQGGAWVAGGLLYSVNGSGGRTWLLIPKLDMIHPVEQGRNEHTFLSMEDASSHIYSSSIIGAIQGTCIPVVYTQDSRADDGMVCVRHGYLSRKERFSTRGRKERKGGSGWVCGCTYMWETRRLAMCVTSVPIEDMNWIALA